MISGVRHICLADDDPDDYLLFSTALKEVNDAIEFTWCNTCEKLLKYLNTDTNLPDLILLDMNMPGMNGQTCLKKLKETCHLNHIPVIIYSTSSSPTAIKSALSCGAHNYLVKPHSIKELKEMINELLLTPIIRGAK